MADDFRDLEAIGDREPPRAHVYDANGLRVSCLEAVRAPFEGFCDCGHRFCCASKAELDAAFADHIAYARKMTLHA